MSEELCRKSDLEKALAAMMRRRGIKNYLSTAFDACDFEELIDDAPAVDAAEVVRCKDCKHWGNGYGGETDHIKVCEFANYMVGWNGYCVYGERKEENNG